MLSSFISRIIRLSKNKYIQIYLDIFRILSVLSLTITFLGLFFYALSYSFLYGYYLSGITPSYYSILNIITNPIPFNRYTLIIVSFIICLTVVFLTSSVLVIKKGKWPTSVATIIFLVAFHFCLSIFFVNGNDLFDKSLSFLIIWSLPVYITIMIFWMIRTPIRVGVSLSGTIYGLFLTSLLVSIFNWSIITLQLLLPVGSFLVGILFTYSKTSWYHYYIVRFILIVPYVAISSIFVIYLLQKKNFFLFSINLDILFCLFLSILLSLLLSIKKIKTKEIKHDDISSTTEKNKLDLYLLALDKAGKSTLLCMLSIFLIVSMVFIPHFSFTTGQYIRDFTFTSTDKRKLHIINDYEEKISIKGTIISIKDGVYYISNEDWELDVLKGDRITVRNNYTD
jgi:hypothetical protein